MKITSFEPVSREDWIHGGRIVAVIDVYDEAQGLMLSDLFLTYDGEKPRVRPVKRKGKIPQVFLTEGRPLHDKTAEAAWAHYSSFTQEELLEIRSVWWAQTSNYRSPIDSPPERTRKKAA